MKLSIVTTLYRSAPTIRAFYERMRAVAEPLAEEVEFVLVNDGSPDDSLAHALALAEEDRRITVVDLARNAGHHKAMMVGLGHATGDLVFLIDCDLEEPPELLTGFHARLASEGWDVVYGVQRARRGGLLERVTGWAFFRVTEALSDHPLPANLCTVRLMRRDYVRALLRFRDREFLIAHLWKIAGFRQVAVEIEKLALSPTTYTLRRRIDMAVRYITTTSTRLLYIFFYFGLTVSLLSAFVIVLYLVRYFTSGIGVDGFTSIILSVWFLGGTTVLVLGVLGIYVANILMEVRRRPYAVIRAVHRARGAARRPDATGGGAEDAAAGRVADRAEAG